MIEDSLLEELINLFGEENVLIQDEFLRAAEQTTYPTSEKILAIIFPENHSDLKKCLQFCNKYTIPLYPISKGKNWGYGSKVPINTDSIIVDLSKLNKISNYNEKLSYVTVEPGVTFQQLFNFLRENKSELIISATGSSGESSLIGNALDRGIGTGLYADRFSHVCNIEVMLPNGDIISTGFGRYGNYTSADIYRWGSGPSLDGLFSQSNFGIVTKMTMWLMPVPENLQLMFYKINSNKLPSLIENLRKLALNGLVRPTITIYNDVRVISTIRQYPFEKCNPRTDSLEVVMKLLKEEIGISKIIGDWNGEISIRSLNSEHGKIQFNLIKEYIKDHVEDITLIEITKDEILTTLQKQNNSVLHGKEQNIIKSFLLGKYIGIPNDLAIQQTYWRKKEKPPAIMNPDTDKCGLIWICPIVPFTEEDIKVSIEIIQNTIRKFLFEPAISLQCMSERAINIIASLSWDRNILEDEELAVKCYEEVNRLLKEKGYFNYRNTTLDMKKRESHVNVYDSTNEFLNNIKNTIDPKNILAPGRYIK